MKIPPPDKRCYYRSARGYRCRRPAIDSNVLCTYHIEDLNRRAPATRLIGLPKGLRSPDAVHSLLEKATLALAAGDLNPKIVTTLAYAAQTLLLSLDRLRKEEPPSSPSEPPPPTDNDYYNSFLEIMGLYQKSPPSPATAEMVATTNRIEADRQARWHEQSSSTAPRTDGHKK